MNLKEEKNQFVKSFKVPIVFVLILLAIKVFESITGFGLGFLGVLPRELSGLIGIITYPLIHGDFMHLFNNSIPLIVLGFITFYSYRRVAWKVIPFIWVASGVLVWLFARQNFHIGASGVVYGLAFFIFFSGVFRKDIKSIALSLFVVLWYGSMIWGLLPIESHISWEGHLFGAIAGMMCAYQYKGVDLPVKHEWDEEQEPELIVEEPFWVKKPEPPMIENIEETETAIGQNESQPSPDFDNELEELKKRINYIYVEKKPPGQAGEKGAKDL